jgi:multidrug efflux pump subunit AcrA (membrane-fusion protein)
MSLKKKIRIGVTLLVILAAGAGIAAAWQSVMGSQKKEIPTVRVKRGNIERKVYTTGELRPARSAMLVAPPVSGTLQIVRLVRTGERVKAGDAVIEFDPSEQEYNLEQARSQVLQAEQTITKTKADAAVQAAQDKVALLQAKFAVRRAELEVSKNELVSAIDAKKNLLNLEEAKRRLAQLEDDIKSHEATQQASLAVLLEQRNKYQLDMKVAQQNIDNMMVKSPINGLVGLRDNIDASGGFFFTGMILPEYRPGDLVYPGRMIAEVLDVESMEILAKVSENDRGNINPGQPVEVRVDTLPGQTLSGKVKTVAGTTSRGGWWSMTSAERKFDATFQLDKLTAEIRPGITAQVVILGDEVRDALYLPRQALFEKDGKPVAYVRNGDAFEAREVKIKYRTESQVAVENLNEGDEVALVNPEAKGRQPGKSPAAPSGPNVRIGGGR